MKSDKTNAVQRRFHHIRQIFQSQTDVRPPAFRMKIYQFADDVKYMLTSLLGRNKLLNPVRKEDDTNLVIILNGRECQCSGNFRHHILLHLLYRTELQTTGNIYQQHHCQFALLLKHLDVRLVEAGGHIPVNVAYVVAKTDNSRTSENAIPLPLEGRVILPGKDIVGQSARLLSQSDGLSSKVLLFPLIYFNNSHLSTQAQFSL